MPGLQICRTDRLSSTPGNRRGMIKVRFGSQEKFSLRLPKPLRFLSLVCQFIRSVVESSAATYTPSKLRLGKWQKWCEELPTAREHKTSRSKTYRRSRCSTGASFSAGASARTACRPAVLCVSKSPTFWEQYKWRIVGALTLIVLQAALIAVLLVERRRRQRAKLALDQLNAELEERIAARTAALDNKSRELETFAYSVAHDLKAPLRGIDGYSRLLVEDYSRDLPDEARSFINTIQTSTERDEPAHRRSPGLLPPGKEGI